MKRGIKRMENKTVKALKAKAVNYKKDMTLSQIKKEIDKFIKYNEDVLIQVSVWDYTDYREDTRTHIDDCYLTLDIWVKLNDDSDEETKDLTIVDIPQKDIPKEQFEATEKKLIKEAEKIGKALQEYYKDRGEWEEDEETGEEVFRPYKIEVKYFNHSLTV